MLPSGPTRRGSDGPREPRNGEHEEDRDAYVEPRRRDADEDAGSPEAPRIQQEADERDGDTREEDEGAQARDIKSQPSATTMAPTAIT